MPMAPARSSGIDTKHSLLTSPILDLKFNLACHRPDSPTSLEDSQSESGDSLDNSDSSATSESETNTETTKDKNATMHMERDLVSSLSQVATPPLSPARPQFDQETETQEQHSQDFDIQDLHLNAQTSYNSMANTSMSTLNTLSGSVSSQPHSYLSSTAIPIALEAATAQVLPVSAWKSLLPGVAPAPAPSPAAPMAPIKATRPPRSINNNYKSHDLRLNEILPIVLPPEREAKLSMEMIDLFESLLPTEESHNRRTRLIKKIEDILHLEWPGQDIKAEPFGSTVNGLGTSTSDVDLCITTTWPGLKNVQMLATAFRKHGMQKVFCVAGAKVPIVKLWDPELHLSCDMNINTPLGLMNTRMIKTYVAIDPRVRPFAMIIKHWARKRVLNDAANGGTISTYTWICIVINFLQMRSPPILPALHDIPHTLSAENQVINGNNTSFCEDLSKLEGFGYANKETLGGLLYAFFRRFAIEFDYDHHVISMRHGRYLTKESKDWHIPGKHYKLFCVEEPLDTSRNLGNSSDMASSKGLKQEFGRALDILIHRGSLNECCEQWVFPPIFYNNNFRNGENSGYHHTHHAAGRRYTLGYRQNNNHNNSYNQYKDQPDIDDDNEEEGEHYVNERSYANFRSMVTTTSTGQSGGYRTNRSNSAPRLDVSAFSGYRNSAKQPPVPFTGTGSGTNNKSSSLRSPISKNGMASSFSGSSFLDQDPFGVPNPSSFSTPSRNRSKSVSAVENNIVAIRPPIKQEKNNGTASSSVTGSGTGAPRQRRSKSSNRSDGSKHVGNNNSNNNSNNANHQNHHNHHNHQNQQHQQHHNHNNSANSGNSGSGGNGNGNGNKQGRSSNNHSHSHNSNAPTNGSGRSPRSTVELSLADIAPKALMSSANHASKDSESQKPGSDGKKGGNKRVVWSTNSNRGESRGTHPGNGSGSSNHAQKGPQSETEKKAKETKTLAERPEQAGPRKGTA
ncbi:hypothetical protein BGZ93_011328 [Podila epicladia]|nr:hypothetical protein BGZ93_011328 [Podila epicladia]KAG0088251.1 hypothetical protein BGZ92_006458 [Podila epicladia]